MRLDFNFMSRACRLAIAIHRFLSALFVGLLLWLTFSSILIITKHFFIVLDIILDDLGQSFLEHWVVDFDPFGQRVYFCQLFSHLLMSLIVE